MGVDSEFRNLLRQLARSAYYPTTAAQYPNVAPESSCHVGTYVIDMNALIRALPLYPEVRSDYGARTWGQMLQMLENEMLKRFARGGNIVVCSFDGKVPENKGKEQGKRAKSNEKSKEKRAEENEKEEEKETPMDDGGGEKKEAKKKPEKFKWSRVPEPWFHPDTACQCGWGDVYYGGKLVKQRLYEFICHFLLYDFPLPPYCEIWVDCGALPGKGHLSRPVRTRYHHPALQSNAPLDTWVQELQSGRIKKLVEDIPGMVPYNGAYTEADDRMMYFVYWATLHQHKPTNCMVETEDGDAQMSLMCTYRTRMQCTPGDSRPKRVFLRRKEICGYALKPDGKKQTKKQPEWIDIDSTCRYVEHWLGGKLSTGLMDSPEIFKEVQQCDPVVFFCMMALMCKNDYVEGLWGLKAPNIIRGAMLKPELARRVLRVQPPAEIDPLVSPLDRAREPFICHIHVPSMKEFLDLCYSNAHLNYRLQKQYQPPTPQVLHAFCARLSWTLDKCINAGRPGYVLPNPLLTHGAANLPVFGYQWYEAEEEETDEETNKKVMKKRKRCVYTAKEPVEKAAVYERPWMSVKLPLLAAAPTSVPLATP
jgi:hypothetical protein